ncbi:MAG: class I SAM-dependent methyltransferase [Acidobacteria bacterium]|nr:class I SAM-dependent methyltransferase [Acidobacteriota bacterium]
MHHAHDEARLLFDQTVEHYQQRSDAQVFNFSSLLFQRRIAIVQDLLRGLPALARVLDYGMGPGVFAPYCVSQGWRYLGLDISENMVARARGLGLKNAEYAVGDLESLQGHRQQMDAVLAIGLIDYLDQPDAGISALAGCVKPGGALVLSFRNRSLPGLLRDAARRVWRTLFGIPAGRQRTAFLSNVHEHSFGFERDLKPLIARCGFSGFEVQYFNCSPLFFNFPLPGPLWKIWYGVDRLLARSATQFFCSGGVLVARKNLQ